MANDSIWESLKGVIRQGTGLIGSVLKPSTWEKELGIPAAIPQALYAAGIGAGSLGDPNAIAGYWNEIEKSKQRKALKSLAQTLGVIKPNEELPPGIETTADLGVLQPQRKYTKGGYWEEKIGQPPVFVPGGPETTQEKLPTSEEWTAAQQLSFEATGKPPQTRAEVFPYLGQARQMVQQGKLDQAAAMTGQKPIHVPGVGFVSPSGAPGGGPKVTPIPGEPAKKTKSDLDTSIVADNMKGIGWHLPDGSRVDPEKMKTRADALAAGAFALPKDDETKFKQYDTVAQTAQQMLALFPAVESKIGTKDWPSLVGRALSQKLRAAQIKTLAKRDPALAQYLERLQTLSLNMTKQVLPAGRIPVWDQQLLMGVFVSPEMNAPTQKAQLEDILKRSEASKANAMMYAKGTLGKVGGAEPTLTPEAAAAQVDEGDTFTLGGKDYRKENGRAVLLQGPVSAH